MLSIRNEEARLYLERWEDLKSERNTWENTWHEVAEYIYPERERIVRKANREQANRTKIIDPTATGACNILASGMHGGLTNPSRPWFRLGLNDKKLSEKEPVKLWLHELQQVMYQYLGSSNFYTQIHALYADQASFGTAAIYCEEDEKYGLRFKVLPIGEYALAIGANGRVDTMYREYSMSVRNIAASFPDLPDAVTDLLNSNDREKRLNILHCIQPNKEFDRRKVLDPVKGRPFESVYILMDGDQHILARGGYMEQPFMAPRWHTVGNDAYGYSPAMSALPDIKMLQAMAKSFVEAVHLALRPPVRVPSSFSDQLNLLPGGQNKIDDTDPNAIRAIYEVRPDLRSAAEKIADTRSQINQAFFTDLFMAMMSTDRRQITAEEIIERRSEKMLQLGPVVEREQHELFDPLIDRVYGILNRAGKLPPPPDMPELQGQSIKIDYISMLSLAQRQTSVRAIQDFVQFVGGVAQFVPSALDKFDSDEAIDTYGDTIGVPPGVIRGPEEVAGIREERAQAEAAAQQAAMQQAQMQSAGQGAQALKTISEIDPEAAGLSALQAGM